MFMTQHATRNLHGIQHTDKPSQHLNASQQNTLFCRALQFLKEAAAMGQVNACNHVACNIRGFTKRWITFQLSNIDEAANMAKPKLRSWTNLILWAGSTAGMTAASLLPRYSSLQALTQNSMTAVETIVQTIQGGIGPLPVNEVNLKSQAEQYLPWLHKILEDYEAAAAAGQSHPPRFSILPVSSDKPAFLPISNSGLHR